MIIQQLRLRNFGPYAGTQLFDFTPGSEGTYDRPLVLVTGKNGVGKSTVMEAIRLCLHGSLALGRSVSREEYNAHLEARIHRPASSAAEPNAADVALSFDHVALGRRRHYEVKRSWSRKTARVAENLTIAEGGVQVEGISDDQKEAFLRELIPPCATDLFLLDNEKLDRLSAEFTSSLLLSEMVQSLLGLDLAARLQRDLDVYLARAVGSSNGQLSAELEAAVRDEQRLAQAVQATDSHLQSAAGGILELRALIGGQEHRIAREGHGFSERLGGLRAKNESLCDEISKQQAVIREMAAGPMPFAITPKFCQLIIDRLEREELSQRAAVAGELIARATASLSKEIGKRAFWNGIASPPDKAARLELANRMRDTLSRTLGCSEPDNSGLLLHASDQDRALLTSLALDSQSSVPQQFCEAVVRLRDLEGSLANIETQLVQIPSHETLAPLVEELNILHQQLGGLQAKEEALWEQHRKQEFEHLQATWRVREARQKLQEAGKGQRTVELVGKTHAILEEYKTELLDRKLRLLERAIAERFNQLCRKPAFVTQVSIDRETFALTLYRYGRPFDRSGFSAGEKQLLATAILWAMRDVSRLPIPVFIDTPLARLDADHREAMIESFIPRVSHQIVLLATDAEADAMVMESLEPLLSRVYELRYDTASGATSAHCSEPTAGDAKSLGLELVR